MIEKNLCKIYSDFDDLCFRTGKRFYTEGFVEFLE